MDTFLSFYSSSKGILHKLKVDKPVAATDDIFIKSYFAKVIKTPELQHEVKKLLKGGTESYADILELIHADYRAQDTGERLRDPVTTSPVTARRGENSDDSVKSLR